MSSGFSVDPAALEAAAGQLRGCAQAYTTAVQQLRNQVLGAGSPWGTDETGSLFGTAYTHATQLGLQALDHLGQLLARTADGIEQMSRNLLAADQASQHTLGQLQQP